MAEITRSTRARGGELLRNYGILLIIATLLVSMGFLSDSFLTFRNLLNILNQSVPLILVSVALTLVVIGGGFDLSTGAICSLTAVLSAWVGVNVDPLAGILIAPLAGLTLGALNGAIITAFRLHSFLATLATGLVYRSAALIVSGGFLITIRSDVFSWIGRERIGMVPVAIFVLIAFVILLSFLLNKTVFGRRVFAVGGNEEAAILSGVKVNSIKIATFALSGLAAGMAGLILTSRISTGQPQTGVGMELEAIAAVILGGTSIYGGSGAIWRSVAGVLLLALIGNAFDVMNINPFYKGLATGLVIVLAVALSASAPKR